MTGVLPSFRPVFLSIALAMFLCANMVACTLNSSGPGQAPISAPSQETPINSEIELTPIQKSPLPTSKAEAASPIETKEIEEKTEKVAEQDSEDEIPTPKPRKKRKKLSPLDRLRQLYFLPLLHPIGRGGG